MKLLSTLLILGAATGGVAEAQPNRYASLKQEIAQAISRDNTWLETRQKRIANQRPENKAGFI